MPPELFRAEMKALICRTLLLDLAAVLIRGMFPGETLPFALGLLLGSAVMLADLLLLNRAVRAMARDAEAGGTSSQRRFQGNYLLRMLLFGAVFAAALLLPRISPAGVAIPMLYPRLIYTAGALFSRSKNASGKRKR